MSTPFDFQSWCDTNGLKKETAELLNKQVINTKDVLVLITESDVAKLEMTLGQRKLLAKALGGATKRLQHYADRSRASHHKVTGEERWTGWNS